MGEQNWATDSPILVEGSAERDPIRTMRRLKSHPIILPPKNSQHGFSLLSYVARGEVAALVLSAALLHLLSEEVTGRFMDAGGIAFPVLQALCMQLGTTLLLAPVMLVSWAPEDEAAPRSHWRELLKTAFCSTATVLVLCFSTTSDFSATPEKQMAQAFIPLFTCMVGAALGARARAGKEELLALLLVCVSCAALLHSRAMMLGLPASGGFVSSVSSHASAFSGAVVLALSAKIVKNLGAMDLTFYLSALTGPMLLPLFLVSEYTDFKAHFRSVDVDPWFGVLLLAVVFLSACRQVTLNRLLQRTSGVMVAVLQQSFVTMVVLGQILLGSSQGLSMTNLTIVSTGAFTAGVFMYSLGAGLQNERTTGKQGGKQQSRQEQLWKSLAAEPSEDLEKQAPFPLPHGEDELADIPYLVYASNSEIVPLPSPASSPPRGESGEIRVSPSMGELLQQWTSKISTGPAARRHQQHPQ